MTKLVIVESPAKCRKIESYLGKGYKCVASFGHIRQLGGPKDGLKCIDFNNNFIKNRKCKSIRTNRVTFNFEITVGTSGSTYQVNYLGNSENLSRGESRLLEVTREALLQTSYIPATSDGIEIQSVIRQPITLPKGVCQ